MHCLRLNFNHLNEHKFWHNFNDTVDSMYTCGLELGTTLHYLMRCYLYSTQRLELLNNVCIVNPSLKSYFNKKLLNILLYGSEDFSCNMNKEIMKATIKFLKICERFNGLLFWPSLKIFVLMVVTFRIYFNFYFYIYMYIYIYMHIQVTFSNFCVLFRLALTFFISYNL